MESYAKNALNGVRYTFGFKHMDTHHVPRVWCLGFEDLRGTRKNEQEEMMETSENKVETIPPKTQISFSSLKGYAKHKNQSNVNINLVYSIFLRYLNMKHQEMVYLQMVIF